MALDNWFQNWHPPYFQPTFYEPTKNYSSSHNEYHSEKKNSNLNKLLPFFLSLNLLKQSEKSSQLDQHGPLQPKRGNYGHLNEDTDSYTTPLHYPEIISKEDTYLNKDERYKYGFRIPSDQSRTFLQGKKYIRKNTNAIHNEGIFLELDAPNKYLHKESHSSSRIPLGYPGSISMDTQRKNYGKSYTDYVGFPDPFKESFKTRSKKGNMTYEEEHNLKPLELTGSFKTWYRWKTVDFKYPSEVERSKAIATGDFVPENNLPLGIEVYEDRIFLSMPKWKPGVPVTLAQLPRVPREESPQLVPYPSWDWHSEKSCDLITSVFRMNADECGRLWVIDSGKIAITTDEATQHCPPKLLIFDLKTDKLLDKYVFPATMVKEDSLHSNIVVDIRGGNCHDAYAYMADVWRFGLVVFRLIDHKAWRVTDHLFFPDPIASAYQLHHLKFDWTDGIFGTALGPVDHFTDDRNLYFHPMSSFREFYVKTSFLRDEDGGEENKIDAFKVLGESRGPSGHVSSSVMDKSGIMYYNLVTRDSIGCWDSKKPYKRENLGIIAKSKETLVFPNDMRLDKENRQSMWIITNRLPYYLLEGLDISRINFRVMSAYTDESLKGTICDPEVHNQYTYVEYEDGGDCY